MATAQTGQLAVAKYVESILERDAGADGLSPDGQYIARAVPITNERRDRYGDIVRAGGIDISAYTRNPVVLFGHGMVQGIPNVGIAANLQRATVNGLPGMVADIVFTSATQLAREAAQLWKERMLRATSVGFYPKQARNAVGLIDPEGLVVADDELIGDFGYLPPGYGRDFKLTDLVEFSVVPIPANQDAVKEMRRFPEVCRAAGLSYRSQFVSAGIPAAVEMPAPETKAKAGDHCPGCEDDDCAGIDDSEEMGVALAADEPAAPRTKATKIAACPTCQTQQSYHADGADFETDDHHNSAKKRCRGGLLGSRKSLTVGEWLALVNRSGGPQDVQTLREGLLRAGTMNLSLEVARDEAITRQTVYRRGLESLIGEAQELIARAGKVLSAANQAQVQAAHDKLATAEKEVTDTFPRLRDLLPELEAARLALRGVLDAATPKPSSDAPVEPASDENKGAQAPASSPQALDVNAVIAQALADLAPNLLEG